MYRNFQKYERSFSFEVRINKFWILEWKHLLQQWNQLKTSFFKSLVKMQITKTKLLSLFTNFNPCHTFVKLFIFLVATYLQPLNLNASLSWMSLIFFSIAQDKVSFESRLPVLPLHSFDDVGFILLETLLFFSLRVTLLGMCIFCFCSICSCVEGDT